MGTRDAGWRATHVLLLRLLLLLLASYGGAFLDLHSSLRLASPRYSESSSSGWTASRNLGFALTISGTHVRSLRKP